MSLKNAIERELKISVRIRAGAPGSLRVIVNGEQLFSKPKEGPLPTVQELIEMIRPKVVRA